MYKVGDIHYAQDGNTFTCPKCNGEVEAIKRIETLGWRCLPCADSKTEVPHNGGAIALGRYAPLARELYCAYIGEPYERQVDDNEEPLPRARGNQNKTKFKEEISDLMKLKIELDRARESMLLYLHGG